jgi:hypothetical protein
MKTRPLLLALAALLSSCSSCDVKHGANRAGDAAGQVLGKFASGVGNGVEEAVQVSVVPSDELKSKGIQVGKVTRSSDGSGRDNVLNAYLIFNQDFRATVTAKAFDSKGLEMGRVKVEVAGKKDDARFVEFTFDKHTDIEANSRVTME